MSTCDWAKAQEAFQWIDVTINFAKAYCVKLGKSLLVSKWD